MRTSRQEWQLGLNIGDTLGLVIVLTLVNPILEEWYWRGFLLHKLHAKKSALWISSLFYSLYHGIVLLPLFELPLSLLSCIPVFAAGMIWGWMSSKYRSLCGSILSHAMAEAGIMVLYFQIVL
ncbi:hypothetical protein GCM10023310_25420 [Paenibacillus vulneris]|uniref:CPBP family intramembrane glutamic endopeptidase n=1 Tax=Paenibacillus vulneris TaxID=1133364 RepID=A0ABW3UV75_9BACL